MMTREKAMEEFNSLNGMIPQGFDWTPDERQKKIGMRMADLFNFAFGNTKTIDENWKLPEEDKP